MGCLEAGAIYVCSPTPLATVRRIIRCPNCKTRRRFVVTYYEWYGALATCCACGDQWSDGERLPRPFARGWRKVATAKAKAQWASATRARL